MTISDFFPFLYIFFEIYRLKLAQTKSKPIEVEMEIENKENMPNEQPTKEVANYSAMVESIIKGTNAFDLDNINMVELLQAKEAYKEIVKKKLIEKKKELIDKNRADKLALISSIPEEARKMPFISFVIALKNEYIGDNIVVKNKREAVKKKPSVKILFEDQEINIEGDSILVRNAKSSPSNKNFINLVRDAYDECFGNKKRKLK